MFPVGSHSEHFFPSQWYCFGKWVLARSCRILGADLLYLHLVPVTVCFLAFPSVWRNVTHFMSPQSYSLMSFLPHWTEPSETLSLFFFCIRHCKEKSEQVFIDSICVNSAFNICFVSIYCMFTLKQIKSWDNVLIFCQGDLLIQITNFENIQKVIG